MRNLILLLVFLTACKSNKNFNSGPLSAQQKYHLLQSASAVDYSSGQDSVLSEKRLVEFCYADDLTFEKAELVYKKLAQNWNMESLPVLTDLLSKDFVGSSFAQQTKIKSQEIGTDINLASYRGNTKELDLKTFKNDLSQYFANFTSIRSVKFEPTDYKMTVTDRASDLRPIKFTSQINFTLKGIDKNGLLREDRGSLTGSVIKVNEQWLLGSLLFEDTLRLTKSGSHYQELDLKAAGLDSLKSYERLEAIRRGGYTLALTDFNKDGYVDFLLGAYGKLQIYSGSKNGKFTPVIDSGIEEHTLVKSAIFADLNNDGHKDLLVVRFVEVDKAVLKDHLHKVSNKVHSRIDKTQKTQVNSVVIYKNLGNGKFEKASEINDSIPAEHAMPAAIADFDNDGLLDIYIGYPGVKDFTTFVKDASTKIGKKAQGVYLNKGNFSFSEKSMNKKQRYEVFTEENMIYPHSAMAVDYNQDGHMDIVVVDDRGNLSVAYKNLGKANFIVDNSALEFQNYGIGMGLAVADYNNDGKLDMALTNVAFNHRNRLGNSCQANWKVDVSKDFDLVPREGMRLFQATNNKELKLIDVTKSSGVLDVGDGLGGVEFLDYDNDGLQDFYVTNGLWTGTSPHFDLTGAFNRALKHDLEEGLLEGPVNTRSFIMDILAHYKDSKGQTPSMAGFQENKLFKNLGKGKFIEVGYLEGVDSIADGYVVGTADINSDGVLDLILRNADPGVKDVKFSPLQIYLGKKSGKGSVQISLEGSISNRDAIGAQLIGKAKGVPLQTRQLIANNGTIQSEQLLWFSLGEHYQLDELTIR